MIGLRSMVKLVWKPFKAQFKDYRLQEVEGLVGREGRFGRSSRFTMGFFFNPLPVSVSSAVLVSLLLFFPLVRWSC